MPYAHAHPGGLQRSGPVFFQALVFQELRRIQVGAYIHDFVAEVFPQRRSQRGKDGVNAAHFIANFPTQFENIIGS